MLKWGIDEVISQIHSLVDPRIVIIFQGPDLLINRTSFENKAWESI